ncbi:MAG: hypothetical protein GY755_25575 [Chloroflexi bacterium]|nr:hypothetical protein [Chloroflexota bacterium]
MIITDKFVHIANPRCGSTFSRKAIWSAFQIAKENHLPYIKCEELTLKNIRGLNSLQKDHHGTVHQIPKYASDLSIVSSVRHPISLIRSTFLLGLWQRRMIADGSNPANCDTLSDQELFEVFLRYIEGTMYKRWGVTYEEHNIGYLTAHFIVMFSRSPGDVFSEIKLGNLSLDLVDESIPHLILHQKEKLSSDFEQTLSKWVGVLIAKQATSIPPSNLTSTQRSITFSKDCEKSIMQREHILLGVLARRGIFYESPIT